MKNLPVQEQVLVGAMEYEFDAAGLLNDGDSIASVTWTMPTELDLVNDVVDGTKVRGFIEANGTAKLYSSYWVTFAINTVGNPTPVSPTLSFEIKIVKRINVMVV